MHPKSPDTQIYMMLHIKHTYLGVSVNGTMEWNGGMERWNGTMEWNDHAHRARIDVETPSRPCVPLVFASTAITLYTYYPVDLYH